MMDVRFGLGIILVNNKAQFNIYKDKKCSADDFL
jgi:hypothetical protein